MRLQTRLLTLALGSALLVGCGHEDKDAPLAFVPADTPYVLANLDVLDDTSRQALLAQYDAQLPTQLNQLNAAADDMAAKDPDSARLIHAFTAEFAGKNLETVAKNDGFKLDGYSAFYGVGLSPVIRAQLADTAAFESFVSRLETAYGKKLDTAKLGDQSYRRYIAAQNGAQIILAIVGKQAVAALLPADAGEPLLRQVLGLDRPEHNLQDDGRLEKLAKDKGYEKWAVGDLDLSRVLPLIASGKDPLFAALQKAHAQAESAQTGEPVAIQLQIPPSCVGDAQRIAARVPQISFGYTRLDTHHQDLQWNVAVASDISQAFSGLKVDLPGLGAPADAPFDLSLALPVSTIRAFWTAQADAVAAKPFTCPALTDVNDDFAKVGAQLPRLATPGLNDILGLRIALDSFTPSPDGSSLPSFTGRLVVGSNNPAGLLSLGQMVLSSLAQLKLTADGKPVPLPADITQNLKQPMWAAMGEKSLALAIGAGEDGKLGDSVNAPVGDAGRLLRMHLSGDIYAAWIKVMQQKTDAVASLSASINHDPATDPNGTDDAAKTAARTKAQFEAMLAQAARIQDITGEAHMTDTDLVISSQTTLK